ncbi:hypothetical protein LCGC14_1227990 [marine sediment metagenome]|uniref:Uncharacterized protein n=1 Tax=marine sediment metagenome TaxID=412755 RepID=A0A0F9NRM7_9ZZZZ|nr:hypothetical protein [Candidatus Scalindua sp.]
MNQEILTLINKLEAIANWQSDSMQAISETSRLLKDSAGWLKSLAEITCVGGIINCKGGEDCTSSHK